MVGESCSDKYIHADLVNKLFGLVNKCTCNYCVFVGHVLVLLPVNEKAFWDGKFSCQEFLSNYSRNCTEHVFEDF